MTKDARIFIRVTDELKARIEAAAAALGLDMSAYITMTLTRALDESRWISQPPIDTGWIAIEADDGDADYDHDDEYDEWVAIEGDD